MANYFYLAMYTITDNGRILEDASFFIQSPQFMTKQQIKDTIMEKEKSSNENITVSTIIEIGEDMFKELAENKDDHYFKIVELRY
ncbi:hypothetical protein QEG73_17870 [Chitinophagaceae bacterium 26-R-25]|nr:hypothetical protein [Chitinophagaceae bacterium 26-R-25]